MGGACHACRLANLCCRVHLCSPAWGPGRRRSGAAAAAGRSLLDVRCARTSHRLTGGATTGGDCWFAWREPTGVPAPAPPRRRSRDDSITGQDQDHWWW